MLFIIANIKNVLQLVFNDKYNDLIAAIRTNKQKN